MAPPPLSFPPLSTSLLAFVGYKTGIQLFGCGYSWPNYNSLLYVSPSPSPSLAPPLSLSLCVHVCACLRVLQIDAMRGAVIDKPRC